jgi:hypothetical protein
MNIEEILIYKHPLIHWTSRNIHSPFWKLMYYPIKIGSIAGLPTLKIKGGINYRENCWLNNAVKSPLTAFFLGCVRSQNYLLSTSSNIHTPLYHTKLAPICGYYVRFSAYAFLFILHENWVRDIQNDTSIRVKININTHENWPLLTNAKGVILNVTDSNKKNSVPCKPHYGPKWWFFDQNLF